jgi:hypothetical protein
VLLTCSDVDEFVPEARVHETASMFRRAGALVDVLIMPGRPHEIGEVEILRAIGMLGAAR